MLSKFKNCTRVVHTNPDSQAFITVGLSYCPSFSSNSSAILFPCIVNTFLLDVGVSVDLSQVVTSFPDRNSLSSMLDEEGIHILAISRSILASKNKNVSWDSAKRGIHHAVKLVSWFYVDRFMHFLAEAIATIGDINHALEASGMSLRKVDPIDGPKEKVHGLRTDTGGGVTREGLSNESSLVDQTIDLINFLTTACRH